MAVEHESRAAAPLTVASELTYVVEHESWYRGASPSARALTVRWRHDCQERGWEVTVTEAPGGLAMVTRGVTWTTSAEQIRLHTDLIGGRFASLEALRSHLVALGAADETVRSGPYLTHLAG